MDLPSAERRVSHRALITTQITVWEDERMKKVLSVFLVIALVFGMIPGFLATKSTAASYKPYEKQLNRDIGTKLRELQQDPLFQMQAEETIRRNAAKIDFDQQTEYSLQASNNNNFTYYGGTKYFLGIDLEFIMFHLRSVGENVEVWVADDLSYGYDAPEDVVTQAQVDMLRDEFERNIYPTDTGFFGQEDYHDGTNAVLEDLGIVPKGYYHSETGKKIILVENIKDESYYADLRIFVSGFYWGYLEYYIDRNIITIDSYRWDARMPNSNPNWQDFQNDVYGTIAHEFQHLIHDDNDPLEETWINEGMADFAGYLCGYGHPWDHVDEFLKYPENSLLIWEDYDGAEVLADYGQAYLLQLYMKDKFGQGFIRDLAVSPKQGIESVNAMLAEHRTGIDFEELFRRFTIACAIDASQPGNGIYQFDSIDIRIDFESAYANTDTYYEDAVPAWGADYKILNESSKIRDINFNGIDFLPIPWEVAADPLESGNQVLWGNTGDGLDNFLILEADLTGISDATLEFDHLLAIEEAWDYGFVQVSTDGGNTWVSLENENTSFDFENWSEYPEIGEQLPGFTGYYEGWRHETFNLSQYAGRRIHIAFRYMTDGAYNDPGWFVDNIAIPEIGFSSDCSSLVGFTNLNRLLQKYVEYAVAFINEVTDKKGRTTYKVVNVEPFNVTQEDALQLRQLFKDGTNYMVVWYASDGDKAYVPFTFDIKLKKDDKDKKDKKENKDKNDNKSNKDNKDNKDDKAKKNK